MRDVSVRPLDALVAVSVGGLCLLVAGVGAIALWAEFQQTWRSFFLFERTLEAAAPVTAAAAVLLVVAGGAVVARAD